jgi:DNA-directed RNA polymerase specialized sigma24 family protein
VKDKAAIVDPKFLAVLGADPVVAEKAYRDLRNRLKRFFEWKGCLSAEDLAQETLTRAFTRIAGGQQIYAEKPFSYFMGIARNVLSESWRARKEEGLDLENPFSSESDGRQDFADQRILLERVLRELSVQDREFLIEYTFEDKVELAQRRGESINALRLRAFRIREAIRKEFGEMRKPNSPSSI